MEFKSYMRDYPDTHVLDKEHSRLIGKCMMVASGLIQMLIGSAIIYDASPLYIFLGIMVMILGLCVTLYGFIYFRKIRRIKH